MHRETQLVSKLSDYTNVRKVVAIAPALDRKYLTLELSGTEMGQKKYTSRSNPYCGAQASSIARRNARERNRVKQVNDSFNALRRRLPAAVIAALSSGSRRGSGKKLSKVDTLRMVVNYIRHLEELVKEDDDSTPMTHMEEEASNDVRRDCFQLKNDVDEDFFCGSNSPYSDSISSLDSDRCQGSTVSSSELGYFASGFPSSMEAQYAAVDDNFLDTMSWWQHK